MSSAARWSATILFLDSPQAPIHLRVGELGRVSEAFPKSVDFELRACGRRLRRVPLEKGPRLVLRIDGGAC